ncbi:MAG: FAD:protein FMN transferase [Solirubrobacteraceae bacterium]|nr:FAD:protein FMN transferase [Solirubrobacteraceae bacterium]
MPTAASSRYVHAEPVMGTVVSFDVRGDRQVGPAVQEAVAWLHRVDARFSTYRPTSEVSRLAAGHLPRADASPQLRWVLHRCEVLRRVTGGYFDERATGTLDPSALVKGWAVQRAAEILAQAGATDLCVTGGGDVACRGGAAPLDHWRVGIQHPLDPAAVAAIVRAEHGLAVATSGAYERGEHVRDPHTAEAPSGVLSVTVVGPDLGTADALSTAAFAMGVRGPAWTATLRGYEALTILEDGRVLRTPGFPLLHEDAA